jgi:hypothetical protein
MCVCVFIEPDLAKSLPDDEHFAYKQNLIKKNLATNI